MTPGVRVAIAMSNCPEYVEVLFAIWYAGLTAVPINAKLHQREFAYILDHSGAKVCFVSLDLAETIAPLTGEIEELSEVIVTEDSNYGDLFKGQATKMREVLPEDTAWLFYTSGTTGQPKERC